MVQGSSKPLSDGAAGERYGPPQPLHHGFDPGRREGHVSRLRSRRPTRVAVEEIGTGRGFGVTAAMMAWVVLAVGIGIAVVGTVQAMRMAGAVDEPQAALDTQALTRQIEQLKIDLDKERAEKQDLLQKLAETEAPAPESAEVASAEGKSNVTVLEGGAATEDAAPAPAANESQAAAAASEPQLPEPQQPPQPPQLPEPAAPPAALPQPMAPSAELLTPAAPAVAEAEPAVAAASVSSFAVHLASFADRVMAERGWVLLQRNHPAALGDLTARIEEAKDETGNPIFLLLAGPFQSKEHAAEHCRSIRSQVVFCKPRAFVGSELTAVQ